MKYPVKFILAGNSKDIIVQAIKTDDLVKFQKELDTLLTVKTVKELVGTTFDEYGNNLWTMAAENGTEEIINYLLNEIKNWPRKDLDHVLHFWTCHRERSCMDIVEKKKAIILNIIYQDSRFENLKKHLKTNTSDPSQLRNYLQTLKQHLDTTIAHLGKCCTPWPILSPKEQLKKFLEDLRKELLFNDLEWHHNSLAGIVSQSYPPDSTIAKRIFKLEIECHNQSQPKATLNETHIEKGGKENLALNDVTLETNENKPTVAFISCIHKRVGKSPCTVGALKMAGQMSTSVSKQNLMPSF